MKSIVAVMLAGFLGGCASTQQSYEARTHAADDQMVESGQTLAKDLNAQVEAQIADYDRRLERWKPLLAPYKACNRNASRLVAMQPGDPISLAVAARSLCKTEEANLRKAIYSAYTNTPSFGIDTMEKVRKVILENNTGEIVASRAKASLPPAPSPPLRHHDSGI